MMWTLTSSRDPVMPTGLPMPSCSSTTKSCGSTCRISRPLGQRHRLRGIDGAPDVLAGDLAVLAGDGHDAAAVEPLHVGARQRQVRRVDLDPGRQFGFVDGPLDGVDRRLEVDDEAPPDAFRFGEPKANDVEPAIVHVLADDSGDLRRPDVEPDQIAFFPCHVSPPACPLPRPAPVRPPAARSAPKPVDAASAARGARADPDAGAAFPAPRALPSRSCCRCGRPHEHARAEAEVHVVHLADARQQGRPKIEVRGQAAPEVPFPSSSRAWSPSRNSTTLCGSLTSICDTLPSSGRSPARSASSRAVRRARGPCSDEPGPPLRCASPSTIGDRTSRTADRIVDDHAVCVDEHQVLVQSPDGQRLTLDDGHLDGVRQRRATGSPPRPTATA